MAISLKMVALVMYVASALIVLSSIDLFFFAPWLALITFFVAWRGCGNGRTPWQVCRHEKGEGERGVSKRRVEMMKATLCGGLDMVT